MTIPQESYANNLTIDRDKCIFCGKCADRCIMDNIRLQLSPCRHICPIGQNVQGYVQQILRGDLQSAIETIVDTCPMPGVLGRICSRPCEDVCSRCQVDSHAVGIRSLKRYVADSLSLPQPIRQAPEGKVRIAVVGSGPAGLMAAWMLARLGHAVSMYEKEPNPGGNLSQIIPEFRLPIEVVRREVSWIEEWGVDILTGVEVGKDISLGDLATQYAAVLVAIGASKAVSAGVLGEDSANVFQALSFLKDLKSGSMPDLGRSVVVLGGGNTALDAAQSVRRCGVESVRIVCLERREEMPAYREEVDDALAEGIVIENGWGISSFVREGDRACAVDCVRCVDIWVDGRFSPVLDAETLKTFQADSYLLALGNRPDLSFFHDDIMSLEERELVPVHPLTLQISDRGLFVAGDVASGPSSVVHAMASGKAAAVSIDRYIRGENLVYGRGYSGPFITDFHVPLGEASSIQHQVMLRRPRESWGLLTEIALGYSSDQAQQESARCLSCGVPVGYHDACWYCLPCEVSCPEKALKLEIPYLVR